MSYQALYRVWRPQSFHDVVGQEHVTKTLQNALIQDKISHAYLFSGPRGTGKTSAAKILAKAVNCERAPVEEPCNECPSCRGITDGSISDVIEIDAASNNGVDEIRDIRDKVKYAPSSVKFKVYIIDEVHMLSIGAFNALLKTLEEPPQHVIFILATTEPHKIPLTILSRCQRFDFKRITARDITGRMKHIVQETGVECDEEALAVVARAAEGGMRDALSLLDQAISFSEDRVTLEDALTVTGAVSQLFLLQLAEAIGQHDVVSGLESLEELLFQGKDPVRFIEDMILFYRDMLLYKSAPNLEESLERVTPDGKFQELAKETSPEDIYQLIHLLSKTQQEMRFTNHPKIFLEVAIVKLCQQESAQVRVSQTPSDYSQLQNRITQLENEIRDLKQHGVVRVEESQQHVQKKTSRTSRKGFTAPAGKINEILKHATKQDLMVIKGRWAEMMEKMTVSQAALLKDAEPVAASNEAFVIKFKYEIHCQMAMEKMDEFAMVIGNLIGKRMQVVGAPEEQWLKIRESFLNSHSREGHEEADSAEVAGAAEEPIIAEAKKLFGAELIEVKD
ncbi:DNA polymerase III subunit gamma/tau [Bacillus benzoevorans]|uniref:DNA-directed DNA polymerase n=1 Tax=Bacillus benzoevorans TaxID=1456 RepID=A0A7X0LXT3_9BACI|nr:DNA polymerase III subunit gamma/tau [Bacillus benzoevorans]MBB6447955.1 DNA polymerase-3 subunit gamma/tau [Bacillus benzoevorans]